MIKKTPLYLIFAIILFGCNTIKNNTKVETQNENEMKKIKFSKIEIDGITIAYREAGNPKNPTIVLLHGFPASSFQYRKILSELSNDFHLIAPDYPGFGNSDYPTPSEYPYTFDNLSKTINTFLEKKGINSYAIMIQDYGSPVGFRIATAHPERITAIINQNGNAYEEGLGTAWKDIRAFWKNRNEATEKALLPTFTLEALEWQYTHGTRNPENVSPDTWNLDYLNLSKPNARELNLDLFYDYQNNLKLYPKWQKYLRDNQPPLLIVWGKNDAFFPESGAAAFKKDVKKIDYNLYNTGHFALEEDGEVIIEKIRAFMKATVK